MHTVLCLSADRVPQGILGLQLWSREKSRRGSRKDRRSRLVCEKESQKWITGLNQAQEAIGADQSLLVVGDRESDIYALFAAPRRKGVELLVRFAHNRSLMDDEYSRVLEALANSPMVGTYEVEIPRQGSRPKRSAKLDVRIAQLVLRAPRHGRREYADGVRVSVIWSREREAPLKGQALDWILVTTEVVESLESAVEMIKSYSARWVIEEFHRVLKSGCRVEQMQFDSLDRLKPAIGIFAVVAWRVLRLTKAARAEPDSDVSHVAEADEVEALTRWLRSKGSKLPAIRTVREFNVAVARLGGFLGRKSDGLPGTKTTWLGLRGLEFLVDGYKLATRAEM
jgi:phosphoglycolate phosphatase-like HAD superfamily hydrolase